MKRTVPAHIEDELKRFDPNLRIRWSMEKRKFVVERRCFRQLLEKPIRYSQDDKRVIERRVPELSDRNVRYRDGFVDTNLQMNVLDRRLFHELFWGNSQRYKDMVREQEDREQHLKDKIDRQAAEDLDYSLNDSYDRMKWAESGRKGAFSKETEQRMGL